jgi:Xaa-Pro aminopeptidase
MVKAETEVALLRKAIDITMEAHREAAGVIAPGVFEYEVEGVLEYTFRRNGAERPAFPSIVGSGPFTTILHYDRNDRQMMDGDLVVVDIGAEYSGYAADVTRTYPVSGRFTDRQREIYQIVLDAQKAALERVRPGVAIGGPNGVHAAAARVIAEAGYAEYFIHGTSHYLGLYVHDVGSSGRPLEAGMVLTVEPGIYLPEEGLGVRIEDDVLVTADGCKNLSAGLPRSSADVEAWMASQREAGPRLPS